MANRGGLGWLGATDSSPRPGCFALGSAQSRAAARALLVARESGKARYQAVSTLNGKPVYLDGLADSLRAARLKLHAEEGTASFPAAGSGQDSRGGRWADCLEERIRRARERVARAQAPDAIL